MDGLALTEKPGLSFGEMRSKLHRPNLLDKDGPDLLQDVLECAAPRSCRNITFLQIFPWKRENPHHTTVFKGSPLKSSALINGAHGPQHSWTLNRDRTRIRGIVRIPRHKTRDQREEEGL